MRILHRNWRHRRDELDIVALDGRFLVVVEVKTLSSERWARPEDAVNPAKQRKLMRAAAELVRADPRGPGTPVRRNKRDLYTRRPARSCTYPDAFYPTLDEQAQ